MVYEGRTLIRPTDLSDLRIDLEKALDRLTPKQRQAVELYRDGFTQQEIADKLGIHKSTVSRIFLKIRNKIASQVCS